MNKRLTRIISLSLTFSIVLGSAPKAKSQSAILAPALCGTGVGCFLVGAITVGGIAYYIWQSSNGKQYRAKQDGRLFIQRRQLISQSP